MKTGPIQPVGHQLNSPSTEWSTGKNSGKERRNFFNDFSIFAHVFFVPKCKQMLFFQIQSSVEFCETPFDHNTSYFFSVVSFLCEHQWFVGNFLDPGVTRISLHTVSTTHAENAMSCMRFDSLANGSIKDISGGLTQRAALIQG